MRDSETICPSSHQNQRAAIQCLQAQCDQNPAPSRYLHRQGSSWLQTHVENIGGVSWGSSSCSYKLDAPTSP